ncbi:MULTISPECIES: cytochrome PufQ [Roseovarius]|uniref:Cytochrome PufQ n=2 Tax=Roseovarius TaxID=74030 RepID=A0ABZ2HD95_9RHOB|nr:cytochrome PufQ [Roseovarius sp. W115]MDV2931105.1 cytochrome PufQ [Roseovarius sp. W115]
MTDLTSNPPQRGSTNRRRTLEYWLYFVPIFFLALPFTFWRWGRDIVNMKSLNVRGPLARAWSEADRITPLIFSA